MLVVFTSDYSFADASSSSITRPPILMPMVYRQLVFWIGEGGRRLEGWKEGKIKDL
jgi:hypothetical protein